MLKSPANVSLILIPLLVVPVLSATILPVGGPYYVPGVSAGQWATYRQLYLRCTPPNPAICSSQSVNLDYGLLIVESIQNDQVTLNLNLATVNADGTGSHVGGLVDVATGYSNLTLPSLPIQVPPNFLVVAGNLHEGESLWNSAPYTINKTISANIAYHDRMVNEYNHTVTSIISTFYGQISTNTTTVFQFDQQTGLLARFIFRISSYVPGYPPGSPPSTSESEFAFGMVDNNIWTSPPDTSYPDFAISIQPPTISTVQYSTATTTVMISRVHHPSPEINATITLTVATSSSSLSCTLTEYRMVKSNTDPSTSQLSCFGPPGTYTVTVTGDSGYSTHSAEAKINIGSASPSTSSSTSTIRTFIPSFLLFLLSPYTYIAVAAAGIITLLAILLIRRKPESQPSL
jgi:hypothetical protein